MRMLDPDVLSFGYLLPTRDAVTLARPHAEPLLAAGELAESLGFDAVWAGDSPHARPRHDALLMLAALAARTQRVGLASGVLLAALRSPLLLAQAAATLDQIAAGRLVLGLGAGFPLPATENEFRVVGVPYAGRVGRLAETIAALRALWQAPGAPVSFSGRHIELHDVVLEPPPRRPGGPPIWLAGADEAAERRVGRLADGWLPYLPSAELYADGWARVQASAAEAERPAPLPGLYATVALDDSEAVAHERMRRYVERYYGVPVAAIQAIQATYAGSADGVRQWLERYVQAGARHIVLRAANDDFRSGLHEAARARDLLAGSVTGAGAPTGGHRQRQRQAMSADR
jgi:alkanesulfonate monooxygenase SsuD/methylene tetrahydromethanopterin reductase-like flavin-dependent oxidoreductase (luciferase family)